MLNDSDRVWVVRFGDDEGNETFTICTTPEELGNFTRVNANDATETRVFHTSVSVLADAYVAFVTAAEFASR